MCSKKWSSHRIKSIEHDQLLFSLMKDIVWPDENRNSFIHWGGPCEN